MDFVNNELQKLSQWFRSNKMSLHPLKSKFTVFYPKPENIQWNDLNLYIDENDPNIPNPNMALRKQISFVNHQSEVPAIKFLGVYFDPALNFKFHISQLNTPLGNRDLWGIKWTQGFLKWD